MGPGLVILVNSGNDRSTSSQRTAISTIGVPFFKYMVVVIHFYIRLCVESVVCNFKAFKTNGNLTVSDKNTIKLLMVINHHLKRCDRDKP